MGVLWQKRPQVQLQLGGTRLIISTVLLFVTQATGELESSNKTMLSRSETTYCGG